MSKGLIAKMMNLECRFFSIGYNSHICLTPNPQPLNHKVMDITDFINGKVTYDKYGGQYFWIVGPKGESQMLAEMRGWGAIQNLFINKDKTVDFDAASSFQDKIGEWIAEAINEKIERERNTLTHQTINP